jgi:hypothetical protein
MMISMDIAGPKRDRSANQPRPWRRGVPGLSALGLGAPVATNVDAIDNEE